MRTKKMGSQQQACRWGAFLSSVGSISEEQLPGCPVGPPSSGGQPQTTADVATPPRRAAARGLGDRLEGRGRGGGGRGLQPQFTS